MEPKARTLTEQTDGPKVSFLAYIQCCEFTARII